MQDSRYRMSLPNCQICNKSYDMYYHIPRVLPKCGHTFCQKCIKSKLTNKKNRLTFTCPECQTDVIIRKNVADELPKNITIAQLVKDVKFKAAEQQPQTHTNSLCSQHNKKLQMICVTCTNKRICAHCAVFGEHKGHNICSQQIATNDDLQELNQCIAIVSDTVNQMLLPDSPSNLEKDAKIRLTTGLQNYVKQNFKTYYTELSRRQAQLLQQCESIMIDQKAGQCLDGILTSFDILKMKGGDLMRGVNRSEVEEIIESAKQLHEQIQKVVESFTRSIDAFLQQSKIKIRQTVFFNIQPMQRRNIKAILKGHSSPDIKVKEKQSNIKTSQNKRQEPLMKRSSIRQVTQRKNTETSGTSQKLDNLKVKSYINAEKPANSRIKMERVQRPQKISDKLSQKAPSQKHTKLIVLDKQNQTVSIKRNYQSAIIQGQSEPPSHNQTRITKTSSVRKTESKTPPKNHSKQKQPILIQPQTDLKYLKPTRQINYEQRPKLQSIIAQIDRQPSQGQLQLIGLEITDALIPYICDYLRSRKLKYSMIKLVKNHLTDQGCKILLSYLYNDTFTKVLNLTSNQLTHKTLSSVLNFITHNNILKTIYLSNNKISPMQLKKIQSNLDAKFVQVVL